MSVKVLIAEKDGEELAFPQEYALGARDVKHRRILQLSRRSSGKNFWLEQSDGISSNKSPFIPDRDYKIVAVRLSNQNNNASMSTTIHAHYVAKGALDDINTNDPVGWYVENSGANLVYNYNGRVWEYDNSSEGDYFYKSNQYAIHLESNKSVKGTIVELVLEEV